MLISSLFLFDMENAFPRPKLPQESFVQSTSVKLPLNISTSTQWYPQGLPLSETLFLLAIDDIIKQIPSPIHSLLFVDDLSIHFCSSNPEHANRILQGSIFSILSWLTLNGFRISPLKTSFIIFTKPHTKYFCRLTDITKKTVLHVVSYRKISWARQKIKIMFHVFPVLPNGPFRKRPFRAYMEGGESYRGIFASLRACMLVPTYMEGGLDFFQVSGRSSEFFQVPGSIYKT